MRLFDPQLARRVASATSLDVLVCSDERLARESTPAFLEVHLLDPGQRRQRPDRVGPDDPIIHVDPVDQSLERLASEFAGRPVLYILGAESDAAILGALEDGSVLLRAGGERSSDERLAAGTDLADLGGCILIGPSRLRGIVAAALEDSASRNGPVAAPPEAVVEEGRSAEELRAALRRSEEIIAGLRDSNQRLSARISELEPGPLARLPGPLARLLHPLAKARARLRPILGVRLGLLWHHHPRELRVPARYRKVSPPAPAPSISIVVPSFNQGDYIGSTLDSILDQGYPGLELIVQDGGSADSTLEVLEGYSDGITHLESGPDGGQAPAINKGFARSSGEIMAWLNSDDILLPGSLAYVARYFDEHPDVDVIYGHRVLIDADGAEIGRWAIPAHDDEILSWADYVPQETMFWRRSIFAAAGGEVDEDFRFALDWDLLVRMREAGAKMVRLPRYIGAFRVHDTQKSSVQVETIGGGEMDRIRRRVHGRRVDAVEIRRRIRPYRRRHMLLDKLQRLRIVRH